MAAKIDELEMRGKAGVRQGSRALQIEAFGIFQAGSDAVDLAQLDLSRRDQAEELRPIRCRGMRKKEKEAYDAATTTS